MKIELICDCCGARFLKRDDRITRKNFCSRKCLGKYHSENPESRDLKKCSEHMSKLNKEINVNRMTAAVREKLRKSRLNTGEGKSYPKYYGAHEHRIVAERMLGRPLKPGEVVHHIDFNKRNNDPSNLMVFENQKKHMEWHRDNGPRFQGGDAK